MLPLLTSHSTPFGWQPGHGAVSRSKILSAAEHLSAKLPESGVVINLCENRINFAVALCAAMLRGRLTLLPPTVAPDALQSLFETEGVTAILADCDWGVRGLPCLSVCPDWSVDANTNGDFVPEIPAESMVVRVYTSGSTGAPCAHDKTWGSLCAVAKRMLELDFKHPDELPLSILATVPAQHMYGLETSVLNALHGNLLIHPGRPLFPADVAAALDKLPGPRVLVTSPTHLRALYESSVEYPPVYRIISATSPLETSLATAAANRFDCEVREIYGCSEAGTIASRNRLTRERWQPYPGTRVTEIAGKYLVEGDHLAKSQLLADELEIASDGTFTIVGRLADMTKVAGKRTSLAALNRELLSIEGVQDGAFVQPGNSNMDDHLRLAAVVVAPGMSANDIRVALRRTLDPVFLPRPLRLVSSIPRTDTGKIRRADLLALLDAN